ncbi:MAG: hypothetical protein PHY93_14450 [Bacteriovorax sp.]|nr:hypothetical protein [Bacteriovorax sp.]
MKKLLILAFASIVSSNSYSLDIGTNALAYTLAQTIYTGALTVATSEAASISVSKRNQKAEATRIQKEVQDYFQTGITSIYLESKIELAKELDVDLSVNESLDLLLEASNIILAE